MKLFLIITSLVVYRQAKCNGRGIRLKLLPRVYDDVNAKGTACPSATAVKHLSYQASF
jgi:hypothetical protein